MHASQVFYDNVCLDESTVESLARAVLQQFQQTNLDMENISVGPANQFWFAFFHICEPD